MAKTLNEFFRDFNELEKSETPPDWCHSIKVGTYHSESGEKHYPLVLVKKFDPKYYLVRNWWSTFTNNMIMCVQKRASPSERYEQDVKKLSKLSGLDSVPDVLYEFSDDLTIVSTFLAGKNSRDLKGNYLLRATELFLDSLSDIHSKGEVHGDALLKNSVYNSVEDKVLVYNLDNVFMKGASESELQFLDYVTLLLSQRKYFGSRVVLETADLVKEKIGKGGIHRVGSYIERMHPFNLWIGRRLRKEERRELIEQLKSF